MIDHNHLREVLRDRREALPQSLLQRAEKRIGAGNVFFILALVLWLAAVALAFAVSKL